MASACRSIYNILGNGMQHCHSFFPAEIMKSLESIPTTLHSRVQKKFFGTHLLGSLKYTIQYSRCIGGVGLFSFISSVQIRIRRFRSGSAPSQLGEKTCNSCNWDNPSLQLAKRTFYHHCMGPLKKAAESRRCTDHVMALGVGILVHFNYEFFDQSRCFSTADCCLFIGN